MNKDYLNHQFIEHIYFPKRVNVMMLENHYICVKCKVIIYNNGSSYIYFVNEDDLLVSDFKLTCEEIIIKNILE